MVDLLSSKDQHVHLKGIICSLQYIQFETFINEMYILFLPKFHIWPQLHLNGQTGAKTASCLKYNCNTVYCNSISIFILPHLAYILKTIKLPVLYINKKRKKKLFLRRKGICRDDSFLNEHLPHYFLHACKLLL